MKRLAVILLGIHVAMGALVAQSGFSQVVIEATYPGVFFMVDEVRYYTSATFMWNAGSTHTLRFPVSDDGFQYASGNSILGKTRYTFEGFEDVGGPQELGGGFIQHVHATPETSRIRVNVTAAHKIILNFWQTETPAMDPSEAVCGSLDQGAGPGVVFIDDVCYWRNTSFWKDEGELKLQAFSYPGWAFTGWAVNGADQKAFINLIPYRTSMVVTAYFRTAKPVRFFTEPMGFKVVVDRVPRATPTMDPCASFERIPSVGLIPGTPDRCIGEMDWAVGSTHILAGISPQIDGKGKQWVFDGFTNGMGENSLYEVTDTAPETFVARYVRGAGVSFHTRPSGLKISVDGRDNWLAYNFLVAPGRTFTVSAPSEQIDGDGRKWVFTGWSNGGEQTQEVTIPPEAVEEGYHLTAIYELLGQLIIESDPNGVPIEIDGEPCKTPCALDRDEGTEVTITAPEEYAVNHVHRLDFHNWSDGGPRSRTITIGSEAVKLKAGYLKLFLLDTFSVPADGVTFLLEPSSPDGFYVEGTNVQIRVENKDGFQFRRWEGDLRGTSPVGNLRMSKQRTAIAMLDEIPYAPPAFVQNAAGPTPGEIVAPGSQISIYGSKLAPHYHVGPANPLAQTLLGVTIRGGGYVLAMPFVSENQINAVLHPDIPAGRHKLVISRAGMLDVEAEFTVNRNAPGLFARVFDGKNFVMASHEDGTPVTPESPARKGELISVFATGLGPYDKIAPYGFALPAASEFALVDPVEVWAGDFPLAPEFAGGAAGFAGTDLIKLRIGDELPAGTLEFKIRVNGHESNTVLLPIE